MRAGDMRLRLELFVEDMDSAIDFYRDVLGFALTRRDEGYASVRRGDVVLGIGPIAKLPEEGGYFMQSRLISDRGLGVEIVLEVEDVAAEYDQVLWAGWPIVEQLQDRPWGLSDFRITDTDGYYLRITEFPRAAETD